jgi:hypothetical protein
LVRGHRVSQYNVYIWGASVTGIVLYFLWINNLI